MDPEGRNITHPKDCEQEKEQMIPESGNAVFMYKKPIFTAVVIPKLPREQEEDDSSVDTADLPELIPATQASESFETSSLSSKDDELLLSLYKYSLVFGLLVGCFIQSSSLGANYILMIFFGRDFGEMAKHHKRIVVFSLAWSFLTSLMGIVILLILRSLVSLATHGLNQKNLMKGRKTIFLNRQLSLVAFLEFPFAFGALAGVCGAWAATDVVLGLHSHAYHSLLTLAVAYVGKIFFEACSRKASVAEDDEEQENDNEEWSNKQPLLQTTENAETKVNKIHKEFKFKGLATGLLVGFFIQFSSLGASFLIDALVSNNGSSPPVHLSKQSLLMFSLGWSFVFGTMGVTILLLLRFLVGIVCDHILLQSQGSDCEAEEEEDMADRWSISLEFFFAVGCLVGVNVAWLITDVGLGLNGHVWRSLITLGAAGVWCFILAHFFGFQKVLGSHKKRCQEKRHTNATMTKDGLLVV